MLIIQQNESRIFYGCEGGKIVFGTSRLINEKAEAIKQSVMSCWDENNSRVPHIHEDLLVKMEAVQYQQDECKSDGEQKALFAESNNSPSSSSSSYLSIDSPCGGG